MVHELVRDGDLASPVFSEPYYYYLHNLSMFGNLLKPVDLRLMMIEVDDLTY